MLKFETSQDFEAFVEEETVYEMSQNEYEMLTNPDLELNQD